VSEPLQPAWSAFEKSVPFPLDLTLDDIFEGVKTVFSAPWLAEQADAVLGALVPYLTGETESFSVVIPLDERKLAKSSYSFLTIAEREARQRLRLKIRSAWEGVQATLPRPQALALPR
jgi:hypothetical protein